MNIGRPSRTPAARPIRLLIVLHTDWDWIKQRPQFLAEGLSAIGDFDVKVAYLASWRRWQLTRNVSGVSRLPIWQLIPRTLPPVRRLNVAAARVRIASLVHAWPPAAILVTHPSLTALLPSKLSDIPLFYDCMDLASGFCRTPEERRYIETWEEITLRRAACVFVSSVPLEEHVRRRTRRTVLVRNGVSASLEIRSGGDERARSREPLLIYAGTVAEWIDFDLLLWCLDRMPTLRIDLYGPVRTRTPRHPRLRIAGAVSHPRVASVLASADALVMPFRVTDLVRAVDPVKLYEYVAAGRPVASVYYPELERFRGLAHFYRDREEFLQFVKRVARGERLSAAESARRAFLSQETWSSRAQTIAGAIRMYAASST